MAKRKHTCACCGYQVLDERPGSYEICPVCFWEDDPVQLLDPWYPGGANKVSLVQGQKNFLALGVSEPRFKKHVKPAKASTRRDPRWRPADATDKRHATTPAKLQKQIPDGPWPWYYWEQ